VQRQERQLERVRALEETRIPESIDYGAVAGLSTEVREKLSRHRPGSLGQASRLSGVTPTAVAALSVHLRRATV
jgi:tRNA uridine 5-carboxymethylaminomethyl modification enzyme